jgi:hypothetical protein
MKVTYEREIFVSAYRVYYVIIFLLYVCTRVEAGSNTSTVTLRVVRGDEMGLKKGRTIA